MKSYCLAFLILAAIGCSQKVAESQPKETIQNVENFPHEIWLTNGFGQVSKYRFVSPKIKHPDGSVTAELWEQYDPLITNRWYTPSLVWDTDRTTAPSFEFLWK